MDQVQISLQGQVCETNGRQRAQSEAAPGHSVPLETTVVSEKVEVSRQLRSSLVLSFSLAKDEKAVASLVFLLLHIFGMVVAFDGYVTHTMSHQLAVSALHLTAALL
eukprot:jgi/Mesen1/8378/ME000468S07814